MGIFSYINEKKLNKLIIDNARGIMLFFDQEGRITDCNAMAMKELGYQQEIKKIKIQDVFKNTVKFENQSLKFLDCLEKPEEAIAYRKNQTCFPVELKISIYQEKKAFIGICVAKNISDYKDLLYKIKRLEDDIEGLKRNRDEITANITHELRTPVNGIMGLSNNLLDTQLIPNQIEIIHLIKRCCSNMETMINDFLDYAKLSNDKMILEQREFIFRDFINSVVNVNMPRINEKGLKLLLYIAEDIPDRIVGDEFRLTQILNNLISNAIKFTTIGHVTLEVAKLSQTYQYVDLFFILIDTGIGISIEDKDKLFRDFSQVDGSITRRFGGTGLGLAICKKLVETMGGNIGVDSERGKGSTFSFSVRLGLPVQKQEGNHGNDSKKVAKDINYYKEFADTNYEGKVTQEINYISYIDRLLKEAGGSLKEISQEPLSKEDIYKNIDSALEKLSICIEMESWDMAEELACYIKKQLTPEFGEMTKIVFRLLLAVRKENYDVSITLINELKTSIAN
jgi:signal transduction histidine kinase